MNTDMKTLIIAEAGVNHNGDMNLAYRLIDVAKEAGADIVKFQTSVNAISKYAEKANYQRQTTDPNESQLDMVNKLRLDFDNFKKLKEYSDRIDIEFLSTPFDVESVRFLNEIGINYWKIPSGDTTNLPYLEEMMKFKKPFLVSTGMNSMDDIDNLMKILNYPKNRNITLLQCTTEYPAPYESVNLNAMISMQQKYGVNIGISDHTMGIEVPIAAVAMGATVVEKHITLDKNLEGPDHRASLEPDELKKMITSIRHIEAAMGDGIKKVQKCEIENIAVARKSIVANRSIKKGEVYTSENIATKRPGTGISAMRWYEFIGKRANRDYEEDELIEDI